ncbi:condensation domain-containing protein [Streptomyces sp. NPDC005840]|uniref:condensation domain-containing protein n=1 Tax=Streptomyces sp. NPDC005840 TaxID=3157072 RepID=UPI0033E4D084
MNAAHRSSTRYLAFDDAGRGTHGLTWGQQRFRRMMLELPEGRHVYVPLHLALPAPLRPGVEETLRSLRTVVTRHDTLRTTFGADAEGVPLATVAGSGRLPVEVAPVPQDGAAGVHRHLYGEMREELFTLDARPLRIALFTEGDTVRRVAVLFSPIALDDWGLSLFKEELLTLLWGREDALTPDPWQPAQQHAWERSPEGRRRSERAMEYWSRSLTLPAPPLFTDGHADTAVPSGGHPFHETVFESPAAHRAAREAAARRRVSVHAVLTAAVLTALTARHGVTRHHFGVYVHNRFARATRGMVGPLSQSVTVGVDTDDGSFGAVLDATARALLPAYRNAAYAPEALDALRQRLRSEGTGPAAPRLFLNLTNSRALSADPDPGIGEPMAEVTHSRFRRIARPVPGTTDLYLGIRPYRNHIGFFARGDGRAVSRPATEALLRGAESVLVAEAEGRHLTPADLRAIENP